MEKILDVLKTYKKIFLENILAIVITLTVIAGIFMFWGHYKVVWFCDEIYSYFISNSGYSVAGRLEYGSWYDSQFVKDDLTTEYGRFYKRTLHNADSDVHPPVYYLVFHTISRIMQGDYSKWVGLMVNFICTMGMGVFLYLLFYKITKKKFAAGIMSVAVCSLPSILTAQMLIRMYCMQTALGIAYLFLSYLLMDEEKVWKRVILYILVSVTTTLGFLTQYYFSIFVVGYTIAYTIYCIIRKKWSSMCWYIVAMTFSVYLATRYWIRWVTQVFTGYRGDEVMANAADFSKLLQSAGLGILQLAKLIFYKFYIIGIILVVVGFVFLCIKKNANVPFVSIVMFGTLFAVTLIKQVTPESVADPRYYYMPVAMGYIAILLIFYHCAGYFNLRAKEISMNIPVIVLLVFSIWTAMTDEMAVGYVDRSGGYNENRRLISQYSDIPWVVYGFENWTLMETYYDLTLGSRFCVYCDWTNFDDTKCPGEGEDFLFFFNNSFDYEADDIVERIKNTPGCRHEVELLCTKGSVIYYVHHK
ncbi:MAG: hypothetical protein ACI4AQ_02060 [Lachnospiraceae bacterium]